jgi:hypothetical protein
VLISLAVVAPYALLLFGGEVGVDHDKNLVTVDGWIKFQAQGSKIAVLVRELRRYLDQVMLQKIHVRWAPARAMRAPLPPRSLTVFASCFGLLGVRRTLRSTSCSRP